MSLLGYDIGGTKCAVVLGDVAGDRVRILGRQVVATGGRGPEAVLTDMARMARDLLSKAGYVPVDFPVDCHESQAKYEAALKTQQGEFF